MGKSQDDTIRDRITGLFKFKSDNTPKTNSLESIIDSSCQNASEQSSSKLDPHTASAADPVSPDAHPPCASENPRSAHANKAISYPPALKADYSATGQLHPCGASSVISTYTATESLASEQQGEQDNEALETKPKEPLHARLWRVTKAVLFHNISNVLLVFVPIAIAFGAINKQTGENGPISPTLTFVMNAIAIIPLASMLSYATECVAAKLGDTIGALLNVTFGNAVELIIFIIALVDNQIAIVQASLLGSILANMLLILGMSFCFGGLRFQEQLYNVRVTQMSAGLLSLSVVSLFLPTAFHASFKSSEKADQAVLKISRGTSVILLLIYIIYLLFQLKSHSYIYESTPQHRIDEEAHPGVLAEILDSSSSSKTSKSSSASDSEKDNASFLRRALKRARRKGRSNSTSTSSLSTAASNPESEQTHVGSASHTPSFETLAHPRPQGDCSSARPTTPEGTTTACVSDSSTKIPVHEYEKEWHCSEKRSKTHNLPCEKSENGDSFQATPAAHIEGQNHKDSPSVHRFDFATAATKPTSTIESRRGLPFKLPLFLPFQNARVENGPYEESTNIRRTQSMPELKDPSKEGLGSPMSARQSLRVLLPNDPTRRKAAAVDKEQAEPPLSRRAAVVLLIISTGLVAVCAEFLVESINYLVSHTGVSQAFVGLIILPIVGNAAEHVTAVTVACKNKMDLAIAVSIGSSIQIALFVTPVVVLLGWILNTEMSLYFTLFETVSLFVSAFIVNYLVMNGRSNYFQGALMMATYVIIAVAAFFYPSCNQLSPVSGMMDYENC